MVYRESANQPQTRFFNAGGLRLFGQCSSVSDQTITARTLPGARNPVLG